jgi:hypothetical protein
MTLEGKRGDGESLPEIERGVEYPRQTSANRKWIDLLSRMNVGDRIPITKGHRVSTIRNAAKKLGFRFSQRTEASGRVYVWRIE